MLEGLDEIDWASRQAEEVPAMLRQLTSNDKQLRIAAYNYIEEEIIFGGQGYQNFDLGYGISEVLSTDVPSLIVPFLIELLASENTSDKVTILSMLCLMSHYVEFRDEGDIYKERAQQIRHAIWEGRELYIAFVNHPDAKMRIAGIDLLSLYYEHTQEVLPHLLQRFQIEEDTLSKSLMLWRAQGIIESHKFPEEFVPQFKEMLGHWALPEQDRPLRLTAAFLLIEFLKADTPSSIVDLIVEDMLASFVLQLPYYLPPLTSSGQGGSLIKLGPDKGIPAALRVIRNAHKVENAYDAIIAALILAFTPEQIPKHHFMKIEGISWHTSMKLFFEEGYKPPIDLESLTLAHRSVLEAIVETNWVWEAKSNLLEIFGLPSKRSELYKLL